MSERDDVLGDPDGGREGAVPATSQERVFPAVQRGKGAPDRSEG